MTDYMRVTSDRISVTDSQVAKQIVTEYLTTADLTLALDRNDDLYITGDWVFAVEHESSTDDGTTIGEPVDNIDFLADIARIAADDSLPVTITEVCEGTFDQHPGLTQYEVTREMITMRTDYGKTKSWDVEQHGIITRNEN